MPETSFERAMFQANEATARAITQLEASDTDEALQKAADDFKLAGRLLEQAIKFRQRKS